MQGRRFTAIRLAGSLVLTALVCTLFSAPALAAPPTSTAAQLQQKQAEKQATLADLERSRVELNNQVNKYLDTTRRLGVAQEEVSQVTTQIAQQSTELDEAQNEVIDRAVELYRGDKMGLIRILFTAQSIPQLVNHVSYVMAVNQHDADLIERVRLARQESLWLQESLNQRIQLLQELQNSADEQRKSVEDDMVAQQQRALQLGQDIAELLRQQQAQSAGGNPDRSFAPDVIMNEAVFRQASALTAPDIQAFLAQQPGVLKYYRAKDLDGVDRSAAEMIERAALAWNVNPRVLLATLQKEQSLLGDANPTARQLDWAMGCGKTDSRTYGKYRGFANQIWFGAKTFNTQASPYRPGMQMTIDGSLVTPASSATYALYRYTPHFRGNMSFWLLYWRYFGDPMAGVQG